jgi:hypothetical protein
MEYLKEIRNRIQRSYFIDFIKVKWEERAAEIKRALNNVFYAKTGVRFAQFGDLVTTIVNNLIPFYGHSNMVPLHNRCFHYTTDDLLKQVRYEFYKLAFEIKESDIDDMLLQLMKTHPPNKQDLIQAIQHFDRIKLLKPDYDTFAEAMLMFYANRPTSKSKTRYAYNKAFQNTWRPKLYFPQERTL